MVFGWDLGRSHAALETLMRNEIFDVAAGDEVYSTVLSRMESLHW